MDPNDFEELMRTQRMMASKIMEESSFDAKIKLLEILRGMTTGKNKRIQLEQAIYEGQMEGFSENDVIRLLDELRRDNLIIDAETGFIKLT